MTVENTDKKKLNVNKRSKKNRTDREENRKEKSFFL